MTNYLLFLVLMILCLAGIPLDGKLKQIVYVVITILGVLGYFAGVVF